MELTMSYTWYRDYAKKLLTVFMSICVGFFLLDYLFKASDTFQNSKDIQVIGGLIYVILIPVVLILLVFSIVLAYKTFRLSLGGGMHKVNVTDDTLTFKSPLDYQTTVISLANVKHSSIQHSGDIVKIHIVEEKFGLKALLTHKGYDEHVLVVTPENVSKLTKYLKNKSN